MGRLNKDNKREGFIKVQESHEVLIWASIQINTYCWQVLITSGIVKPRLVRGFTI
jgi:hypothetical protein